MTTNAQILALPMPENDAGAATVREYLAGLLLKVWVDREIFDGKKPYGNSDWEYEVYAALAEAGLIETDPNADGMVTDRGCRQADELVDAAIRSLGEAL